MRGRSAVAAIAAMTVAGALAAGCGSDDSSSPAASSSAKASEKAPEAVSIVMRNDVDTFDPYKSTLDSGPKQMYEAMYDTLVRPTGGEDHGVEPAMAKSWEVTLTSGTFQLKDGLTCADGSPLTATDVAKSLRYLADPKTGSQLTNLVFGPGGAKSVTADDDANTVKITLNKPHPDLLGQMQFSFIICPKGLADKKALASSGKGGGSGPYRLTTLKRDDHYVLERREDAAIDDPAKLPAKVTLRVVADDTTRANLVDTGEVDIAAVLGRDAERLKRQSEPVEGRGYLSDSLLFNRAKGHPGNDPNIRKAVAHAVDAKAYTRAATFDVGYPVDTQYTPNMECYSKENGSLTPPFDLAQAKAALTEAGYGSGKKLTLKVVGYDAQNSGPEYLGDALRKAGIDAKVNKTTFEQLVGIIWGGKGDWDVMVFPFVSAAGIPYTMVNQISYAFGTAALNPGQVKDTEYDKLALKAAATEGDERCQIWQDAEKVLLRNVDVKPLTGPVAAWFQKGGLAFEANMTQVNLRSIRTTD